jgi:2,4-dienoyl-CoA reductase-like NADH-dependent reductase (Old Yellow Enzyme family)
VGPSPIAFDPQHTQPRQLDEAQIADVIQAFVAAAKRALTAGFSVVEVHAAHGYLLHQFLSPLSNQRRDQYGGSFENRIRLVLQVTGRARGLAARVAVFVRVSATDWVEDGWNPDETVELARRLKALGADLIDVRPAAPPPTPRFRSGRAIRRASPSGCARSQASPPAPSA